MNHDVPQPTTAIRWPGGGQQRLLGAQAGGAWPRSRAGSAARPPCGLLAGGCVRHWSLLFGVVHTSVHGLVHNDR